jgi:hypothetical protein
MAPPNSLQEKKGPSRYPKRNRQSASGTREPPLANEEKLERRPVKRRKTVQISPGAMNVASFVERLSNDVGRRELDEIIRVKQEEAEVCARYSTPSVSHCRSLQVNSMGTIPTLRVDEPAPVSGLCLRVESD